MEKFLTIGFLSKLSLKKKNKDIADIEADNLDNNIERAKKNLRSFIDKE